MSWVVARNWCLSLGMKLPQLKTIEELDEVTNELTSLGYGKISEE